MIKLTSKMKSTYKIGLENRRTKYLRRSVLHTSGSHCIFDRNRKNRLPWFSVRFVDNTYIGPSEAAMASVFTLQHQVRPLEAVRAIFRPLDSILQEKTQFLISRSIGLKAPKRRFSSALAVQSFQAMTYARLYQ